MLIGLFVIGSVLLFVFLPWQRALLVFLPTSFVFLVAALLIRRRVAEVAKRAPETGTERMIGDTAEVVSVSYEKGRAEYLVRYGGELWSAGSKDVLFPGEQVRIIAVDGVRLIVERVERQE